MVVGVVLQCTDVGKVGSIGGSMSGSTMYLWCGGW